MNMMEFFIVALIMVKDSAVVHSLMDTQLKTDAAMSMEIDFGTALVGIGKLNGARCA